VETGIRHSILMGGVGGGWSVISLGSVGDSVVNDLPSRIVGIWEDGLDDDDLSSLLDVSDDRLDFLFWGGSIHFLVVADG